VAFSEASTLYLYFLSTSLPFHRQRTDLVKAAGPGQQRSVGIVHGTYQRPSHLVPFFEKSADLTSAAIVWDTEFEVLESTDDNRTAAATSSCLGITLYEAKTSGSVPTEEDEARSAADLPTT
jgi:hypothetical protein